MKRILSLAIVAALSFGAATSCKNSAKEAADSQPVEEAVTSEDGTIDEDLFEEITPVEEADIEVDKEDGDVLTYTDIEVKPKFQDGDEKSFQKWIVANVKYPLDASEGGREGTVMAQFTVDKEGKITNVKILRSVNPILDAEAVRVIESAPNWKPASHKGEPIEVSFVLPVKFEIL